MPGQTGSMPTGLEHRPERGSGRGRHRRRGPAPGGHERQPRLRVPRRRRGHDAAPSAATRRPAGWWSAPRSPTATGRTSAAGTWTSAAAVLTEWVAGAGRAARPGSRRSAAIAGGLPQAARRALQPGGRRRGPGGGGARGAAVRCPCSGCPGSAILRLAEADGRTGVREGFPDRGYTDEGRLVPRDQPGALVEGAEAIAANAVEMAAGRRGPVAVRARRLPGSGRGRLARCGPHSSRRGTTCGPGSADAVGLVHRGWVVHRILWTTCGQRARRCGRCTPICGRAGRRPKMVGTTSELLLCRGPGRRVEISSPQPARVAGDRMNTAGPIRWGDPPEVVR